MESKGLAKLSLVRLDEVGNVDMADLEQLLTTHPHSFVTLMHANNEIGNMISLKAIGELCHKYSAYFHSDTVQTMGHYAINLAETPIHFLNASAHKFHGPKGVGFMYVNKQVKINPDITGGGQERGMRGGTENLYGIVGLAKALELGYQDLEEHASHIQGIKNYMILQLTDKIQGLVFNGNCKSTESLYTVVNVTLPENPNADMLLFLLDLEGIACSGGSACSSGAAKGSHVLDAIGALKTGSASTRFSFSRYTTQADIDLAVSKLAELCLVPVQA